MRAIISIIILFAVGFGAMAQTVVFKADETSGQYTTDQTQSGTTAKYVTFHVKKSHPFYYRMVADIDSAGDGTDVTVTVEGSDDNSNYTTITSTTYGVTADTVITFTNFGTSTRSIASYTIRQLDTTATYTVTSARTFAGDSCCSNSTDTATYPAIYTDKTQTIAAQTITDTDPRVMWRYIRLKAVSTGSGGCVLANTLLTVFKEE